MATLTGKQAKKLIEIFEDTPTEQVQAVLESGFLADLRDGNIDEVRRDDFRKLLGLKLVPGIPRFPHPSNFVHDQRKEGWKLIKNVERRISSIHDLELVPFLKGKEPWVRGTEVMRRAREELDANYGQEDAEYLLAHRDEIPKEFEKYILIFPGTVWGRWDDSCGNAFPCLRGKGGGWAWGMSFGWPTDDFDSNNRLVRPSKRPQVLET